MRFQRTKPAGLELVWRSGSSANFHPHEFQSWDETFVFLGHSQLTWTRRTNYPRTTPEGKDYVQRSTPYRCVFKLDKDGLLYARAYTKQNSRPLMPMRAPWPLISASLRTAPPEVRALVPSFNDVYPSAAHWQERHDRPLGANTRVLAALRQPDLPRVTRALFGPSLYRKDLARATAEATLFSLYVAREFRGLVPVDWIVRFLRQDAEVNGAHPDRLNIGYPIRGELRTLLRVLDPRSYRDLLFDAFTNSRVDPIVVRDIAGLATSGHSMNASGGERALRGHRVSSFDEVHDLMWPRFRRENYRAQAVFPEPPAPREIPVHDLEAPLQDAAYRLGLAPPVFPRSTATLNEWSSTLHNCISSYATRAASSSCLLGVIPSDPRDPESKPIAAFEVTDNRLIQFLGPCNNAQYELAAQYEQAFTDAGVKVTHYSGRQYLTA